MGLSPHGTNPWGEGSRLTVARFDHPAQQIVLQDYIQDLQDAKARLDRPMRQIAELLPNWSMAPVVTTLQAMRGVALVVAVAIVAEFGGFCRFAKARQLMAYLGLAPSEAFLREQHPARRASPTPVMCWRGGC